MKLKCTENSKESMSFTSIYGKKEKRNYQSEHFNCIKYGTSSFTKKKKYCT